MERFVTVSGIAAPLPAANIDTDVIMPKQFLKTINRDDLARGALYDLRFEETGAERADFILNREAFRHARFLIVGPNFGCGSSREHAVWGLMQLGIRAVIGTSFGSIFYDNCFQNGLLAIKMDEASIGRLWALCSDTDPMSLTIDLPAMTIEAATGDCIAFSMDPLKQHYLINGLDTIGVTLQGEDDITDFETVYRADAPWNDLTTEGSGQG